MGLHEPQAQRWHERLEPDRCAASGCYRGQVCSGDGSARWSPAGAHDSDSFAPCDARAQRQPQSRSRSSPAHALRGPVWGAEHAAPGRLPAAACTLPTRSVTCSGVLWTIRHVSGRVFGNNGRNASIVTSIVYDTSTHRTPRSSRSPKSQKSTVM